MNDDTKDAMKGAMKGDISSGTYTDPDSDPDPGSDSEPIPSDGCSATNSEQRRADARAATREVAEGSGWVRWRDRAAFDADVATMPLPGMFASPPQARMFGYKIFDANPGAIFDDLVAKLQQSLETNGIATSEAMCRQAMADVFVARAPRDRAWDRGADRDRRRGRR